MRSVSKAAFACAAVTVGVLLAGCSSPTQGGGATHVVQVHGLIGSAEFHPPWNASHASSALSAEGFVVLWATEEGLMTADRGSVQPSVKVRDATNWTFSVLFLGAEDQFAGPSSEAEAFAGERWAQVEPAFGRIVRSFEARTGYANVSTSWRPLVAS